MDSLLVAAARCLAAGDPLGALKRVALRDDPPALALRGTAMAQLGDYVRARKLLQRAARAFGSREPRAQARCRVAEAEVALAARDLSWPMRRLEEAARTLAKVGDPVNSVHARLIAIRRLLLVGDIKSAEKALVEVERATSEMPCALRARAELTRAELALRRIKFAEAKCALERAQAAAVAAGIPALIAEMGRVERTLLAPSARIVRAGVVRVAGLEEVEALFACGDLIVDACRRTVHSPSRVVSLGRRPVLFGLLRALAEAWPADVPRDELIREAFMARASNASYRARLRVEIGRARAAVRGFGEIQATAAGFRLLPMDGRAVVVLAPPLDGPAGAILALLEGGEPWSTSALASALGTSQRSVQRVLAQLEETAGIRGVGRGRSRRWLAPALSGFATTLLLPGALTPS